MDLEQYKCVLTRILPFQAAEFKLLSNELESPQVLKLKSPGL